ncbi:MAG: hemolysin family protein [Gammaproteobacteria bacterium]|jgi:CBS domain containing-hemolysin-like protein
MLLFASAVAVVLVVSFLCSIFESVLLSLSRPKIELLAKQGSRAAPLLAGFKANMDVPIAAILILNTAAHTVGAAVAGASYSNVFDPATLWVFSLVFTIAVLLFTEIIPKTLGVSHATALAVPVAHGIHLLTVALKPLVVLSERISRSLRRDVEVPITSAEEIRLLAILGHTEGAVGPNMAGMIVGATQLRHLQARHAMLPREDVRVLSADMDREAALERIRDTRHSRYPLTVSGDLNDATGIVLVRELLEWFLENESADIDWGALRRETPVVPETVPLMRLLKTFQETSRHLAIVVDEYGAAQGIVTLEDVVEEIVGDIRDESDAVIDDIREETDGTLIVRADVDLRRISHRLGLTWEPNDEVSTIGGLVAERLERIPETGDVIEWNDFDVEVIGASRRRAESLAIRRRQ